MPTDLYAENRALRKQIKAFVAQARANEQKMRRFQEQELRLIGLNSLAALIDTLLNEYRVSFDLDEVALVLVDQDSELRHILESEGMDLEGHPQLIFREDSDDLDALYGGTGLPLLERYEPERHDALFPRAARRPESVALVPLVRQGEMIGSLNLGSCGAERFVPGAGTDFLQRLAAVAAICLENAANHERIKRVGLTDCLTLVNNRRFFEQRLPEEITRCRRSGSFLSCLLLDIDHFKPINDTHGHPAGDRVLKEAAARIGGQLRCGDVLARYGGEEFAVLLIDSAPETAAEIAERIRAALAAGPISVGKGAVRITVSIGVAGIRGGRGQRSATELGSVLVDRADQALYRAKHEGRNRVVCAGCLEEG